MPRLPLLLTAAVLSWQKAGAAETPAIHSLRITTPSIDVTRPIAAPKVRLVITGGSESVTFNWAGPAGQPFSQTFIGSWDGPTTFQGYVSAVPASGFALAFNLYAQPGTWTLQNVLICNQPAGCTNYSGASLARIANGLTFTLVNPNPPDITPPTVFSARLLTTTVSLANNPTVKISANASDDLSGLYALSFNASTPGTQDPLYIGTNLQSLPHSANFRLSLSLPAGTPTGIYTITSIFAEDVAGNTRMISDAASIARIMGGAASFTVTP